LVDFVDVLVEGREVGGLLGRFGLFLGVRHYYFYLLKLSSTTGN
jgi:hypothetical protein